MKPLRQATPEQRWNAALAAGLCLLLLLFGWPSPRSRPAVAAEPPPPAATVPPVVLPATAPAPVPLNLPALPLRATTPAALPSQPQLERRELRVVALTDGVGSSDEALARSYVPAAVLVDGHAADVCALLPVDTDLVLTAHDLGSQVRQCLTRSGTAALAFDSAGTAGTVLSLRRGLVESVLDQTPLLVGRIGIVGETPAAAAVAKAAAALTSAGHPVVATALLDPSQDTDAPGVLRGLADFAAAQVETVVFAVAVSDQALWVQGTVLPQRFVVADASDAIVDEAYPDGFDGAQSLTTVKGPWFTRAHGSTPLQRWCRTRVTASLLASGGAAPAMRWCALGSAATLLEGHRETGSLASQLRSLTLDSPVTSKVGPRQGAWGPSSLARVVWRKGCRCFVEAQPFPGGSA